MLRLLTDLRVLPVWLVCGALLGVAAARHPFLGILILACFIGGFVGSMIGPTLACVLGSTPKKYAPKFSLRGVLFLIGLIGCLIALRNEGDPWKLAFQFSGSIEPNIAMSPDGSLVAASQGTSIEIRETKTGKSLATLDLEPAEAASKAGKHWHYDIAFSEDNQKLLTAGWNPLAVTLHDWKSGELLRSWPIKRRSSRICQSGQRFLCRELNRQDNAMSVYSADSETPLLVVPRGYFDGGPQRLSANGRFISWDANSGELKVHAVDSDTLLFSIPVPPPKLITGSSYFSSDEKLIAVPTQSGIAVWDIFTQKEIGQWQPPHFVRIDSLEWSPDGERFLATYLESNAPAARNFRSYLLDKNCNEISEVMGTDAAFSPSGDRIATVQGNALILDGQTGVTLTNLKTPGASRPIGFISDFPSLCFSPDSNWLLTNGQPSVFQRTRSEHWYSILTLPSHWGVVFFLTMLLREFVGSLPRKFEQLKAQKRERLEALKNREQTGPNPGGL